MNRIDQVVTFRPLGEPELQRILDIELDDVRRRLARATGSERSVSRSTRRLARCCCGKGPTPLRRAALEARDRAHLVHPMSNLIATKQLEAGDRVWVECDGDRLVFSKQAEGLASAAA